MYYIYNLTLEYKAKGESDLMYRPWSATKLFPLIPGSIRENPYRSMGKDGYLTINLNYQAVYQDNYDHNDGTDKMVLRNGTQVILEAPSPEVLDKLRIVWLKCSCGNSPMYRLTLNYVGETTNRPVTVKSLPL